MSVAAADPTLGSVSLAPRVAVALVSYSLQLQQQAPTLGSISSQQLTRAAASALDKALLTGTGGAQPIGLLTLPITLLNAAPLPFSGATSILKKCVAPWPTLALTTWRLPGWPLPACAKF